MQSGGGAGSTGNAVHLERTKYSSGTAAAASAAAVAASTASSSVLRLPVLSETTRPNSNKTPRFLALKAPGRAVEGSDTDLPIAARGRSSLKGTRKSEASGWQSVAVEIKIPGDSQVLQVRLPLPDSAGLRACEYCSVAFADAPPTGTDGSATSSNSNRVNLEFDGRTVHESESRMRNYSPQTDDEAEAYSRTIRRAERRGLSMAQRVREAQQKERLRAEAAARDASEL